jgi:hypothetical protein
MGLNSPAALVGSNGGIATTAGIRLDVRTRSISIDTVAGWTGPD